MTKLLEATEIHPGQYVIKKPSQAERDARREGQQAVKIPQGGRRFSPRLGIGGALAIAVLYGSALLLGTQNHDSSQTGAEVSAPTQEPRLIVRQNNDLIGPFIPKSNPDRELGMAERLAKTPRFLEMWDGFMKHTKGARIEIFEEELYFSGVRATRVLDLPMPHAETLEVLYAQDGERTAHALLRTTHDVSGEPRSVNHLIVDSNYVVRYTKDGILVRRLGFIDYGPDNQPTHSVRPAKHRALVAAYNTP